MAEPKTKRTRQSVTAFIDKIPDERKRGDAKVIVAMMKEITHAKPEMWGPSIVGFGSYRYTCANGSEADWPIAGFSPRKQSLVVYIMPGFEEYGDLMKKLGKHTTGKTCLYIKSLDDVHLPTLRALIQQSVKRMSKWEQNR